jgi:hypothetical protein
MLVGYCVNGKPGKKTLPGNWPVKLPQIRFTDAGDVTPACVVMKLVIPGVVHWKVAAIVLDVDTVSLSSVTVTLAPDTVTVSPLLGLTVAPARNVPIAGEALSTALPDSSMYTA